MDSQCKELCLKPCTKLWEEQRQRDRLSILPDEILIQILSLLPTKSAVVVCVLMNKRVLPWITSLDFDASPISHCLKCPNQMRRFPSFQNFVDSVLQAHQASSLTRFRLNLGASYYQKCNARPHSFEYGHNECCLPDVKSTQINAWITFPLSRCGLRELDLCVHLRGPPGQSQLPPEVFMKETLEVLKLDVNLRVDGTSIFRLPNLKTLHLYAFFISEDAFLTNLVSSCPVLEELKVSAWWNYVHFTRISSITSMPRLVKAEIDFDFSLRREIQEVNCQKLLIFISALSNVRHLTLDGVCPWILDSIQTWKQLPVFHDLVLLELKMFSRVEGKALVAFLYCSPNLKTLVFPGGFGYRGAVYDEFWEQESGRLTLATIPWCCRFNLKRIVVYGYHGSDREIMYIEFLLKYSLVLEELVVLTLDPTVLEITLQNIPRASNNCLIQLRHCGSVYPRLH